MDKFDRRFWLRLLCVESAHAASSLRHLIDSYAPPPPQFSARVFGDRNALGLARSAVVRINFNDNSRAQPRKPPPTTHTASYFWIGKSDEVLAARFSGIQKHSGFQSAIPTVPKQHVAAP